MDYKVWQLEYKVRQRLQSVAGLQRELVQMVSLQSLLSGL